MLEGSTARGKILRTRMLSHLRTAPSRTPSRARGSPARRLAVLALWPKGGVPHGPGIEIHGHGNGLRATRRAWQSAHDLHDELTWVAEAGATASSVISAGAVTRATHGQIYLRSTASLRIARRLRWPWSLLSGLLIIPRPLRDLVYRLVAAIRHQLAGRSNACEIQALG